MPSFHKSPKMRLLQSILLLTTLIKFTSQVCLPSDYYKARGYTPLEKIKTGEEWLFCKKMLTESGICVDETTIANVVKKEQEALLTSQYLGMAGINRILGKAYPATLAIREKLQSLEKQRLTEESKVLQMSQKIRELYSGWMRVGDNIEEITYFNMDNFNNIVSQGLGGDFRLNDLDKTNDSENPDLEYWVRELNLQKKISEDIIERTSKIRDLRFVIRGKIQRNQAKINALASKKEIVPGWPLKGTPTFALPAGEGETNTDANADSNNSNTNTDSNANSNNNANASRLLNSSSDEKILRSLESSSLLHGSALAVSRLLQSDNGSNAIVINAIEGIVEGEKPLPSYTPPDSIELKTITFEDTQTDELSEIQQEKELRVEEKKLKAREDAFVEKEIEMLKKLAELQTTDPDDIESYFAGDYLTLMDKIKSQNEEKFGELTAFRTATEGTFAAVFTELKKTHDLFERLKLTYNHYKSFESNIYDYYYDPTVTQKPTLKDADWKALYVQFTFDNTDTSKTYDDSVPFVYEDLRKLLQDQFRLGRTKFEEALQKVFDNLEIAENTRMKEMEKYYELSRANKIKRELYVNSNESLLDASIDEAKKKIINLRADVNNEDLAGGTTARIAKGEQMFSLDMLYRVMIKIKALITAWKVKIADNTDVDLWSPVMTKAAKRSFNVFRLQLAWMENSVAQLMIDITKPGYEMEYQSDFLIYNLQRTELNLINANMNMNIIRIKENRDKFFESQFKVIAGTTCAMIAGNAETYFTLETPPADPPADPAPSRVKLSNIIRIYIIIYYIICILKKLYDFNQNSLISFFANSC